LRQQNRLYRDVQNDYWEARARRARRARRVLAVRKTARTAMSVLIVVVVLGATAAIFSGKAGSIVHSAEVLVGSAAGPAVEPEREVEATYQPGGGGEYMAICTDPRGAGSYDLSGGANWTSLSDLEPYLAADSVTRQFAEATGGTFVPA